LARATAEFFKTKCDFVNMSFGEASIIPDSGHFIKLIRDEIVGKCEYIFLSSVENEGSALSTTGSPNGTSSSKHYNEQYSFGEVIALIQFH